MVLRGMDNFLSAIYYCLSKQAMHKLLFRKKEKESFSLIVGELAEWERKESNIWSNQCREGSCDILGSHVKSTIQLTGSDTSATSIATAEHTWLLFSHCWSSQNCSPQMASLSMGKKPHHCWWEDGQASSNSSSLFLPVPKGLKSKDAEEKAATTEKDAMLG